MKYTLQLGHMEKMSILRIGDKLKYGDSIGIMGTSGQSKWPHLHAHLIEGFHKIITRLKDVSPTGKYKPNRKQLKYFIDKDLFKIKPYITTQYNCSKYKKLRGKSHYAIDVVPIDRHKTKEHFIIYWNRTKIGTILNLGFDENGYGYFILIGYETL